MEIKEKILHLELTKKPEEITALVYIENHFFNVIKQSNSFVEGTKKNYRKSVNHFKNYLHFKKNESVPINGITKEIAFGFYDYLQQAIPAYQKSGITDVSASNIVIKIKAIFERAYDTEIIKKNPFKGLKLQNKSPKKEELNISEFKRFYDLDLLADRKLEVYKDIFLFSVFTGLPYGDIYCLTWNQIRLENQEYILQKNSAKTKVEIK